MLISVIIPCYNSERSIREVVELVRDEFEKMPNYECEFLLVNDGSADDTYGEIKKLAADYKEVHGINLMRNFGQHNAIMCGMNYTSGDYILGMDDDLQTHPSQIHILIEKIEEGYDLVYGVYKEYKNSKKKQFTSWLNRVSSGIMLGRPKNIRSSNFWIITRAMRDEVIKFKNFSPYVDGLFYRSSHNIANVTVEHHKREYGQSNYTLLKMVKLWLAYWNYSVLPLRIASVTGFIAAAIGIIAGICTIILKIADPTTTVGWASTICILLFFFGLVLIVLGIIGEYIGKIMLSMNGTPQYIIREKVNL